MLDRIVLPDPATCDSTIITMSFGICLFQQREPGLVLVFALSKVKCLGSCLHDLPILILRIRYIDSKPLILFLERFVEVFFGQVELVINDLRYPFTILTRLAQHLYWTVKPTAIEHEAIDPNLLVPGNAHLLKKILFIAESTDR